MRAATRELPHRETATGPRDDIGTRQGLDRAMTAILHALEAGAELAYVVSELGDNPTLTGPPRALSLRAQNDMATNRGSGRRPAEDIVWVSPADILAHRAVPLPPPVAEGLKAASATVIDAAAALSAATVATCAPPGRLRTPGPVQLDTTRPRPRHLPAIKPTQDASHLSPV